MSQGSLFRNHSRGDCHQSFSQLKSFSRGDLAPSTQNYILFPPIYIGFQVFHKCPTPFFLFPIHSFINLSINSNKYLLCNIPQVPARTVYSIPIYDLPKREFHYKSVKGKDASCLEGIPNYISERKGILCKIGDILAKEQVVYKLMYHEIWRTACQKERTACMQVQRRKMHGMLGKNHNMIVF